MDVEKLLTQEFARRDAYKGLSDCYKLPEEELINTLEGLERVFGTLGSEARSHISLVRNEIKGREEVDDLKVDYARLFVGPYSLSAPPYGSVYLDGSRQIMGNSTMDVQRKYKKAGFDLVDNFKDAPDHIAVELEFMDVLVFQEIEALDGDRSDILELIKRQHNFLQVHIGAWVKPFTDLVAENAYTDFYRNLARATLSFINEERVELMSLTTEQVSEVNA